MDAESVSPVSPTPGRRWTVLGLALTLAGIAVYLAQVKSHHLTVPWYLPLTGTLGLLLIAISLWQRRGVWRAIALVCVLLVAGFEWMFVLGTSLPVYSGPVAVGKPFPDFSTTRADGASFTQSDLAEENTVLLFFRGRW